MSKGCLGLDTSNYTTSTALFDGCDGVNAGRLLDVPVGTLGLRQSDALFQHVKKLPHMVEQLNQAGVLKDIAVVGASTQPRAVEGSYMPCFLAGESMGRSMASLIHVPFFACSHQQGHIAAAAWSAGRMDLLDRPHLAWHLSGGTTELLLVEPQGHNVTARCIGGTSDISAGQLIDRGGKLLGIPFPAGKAMDALAENSVKGMKFKAKMKDLTVSFSGLENKTQGLLAQGEGAEEIAAFVLGSIAQAVCGLTERAQKLYPDLPILCSGGVASNRLLRREMEGAFGAYFAQPQYATDNAMGVAILGWRAHYEGV